MFSRFDDRVEKANPLSLELVNFIQNLIQETFEENLKNKGLDLQVYGETYDNEIVLIFSLLNSKDSTANTISLFISDDISQESKIEEKIDFLINSSSDFFETICSSTEEELVEIYSPRWQETKLSTNNFYYKISRENIILTIEANKLLGE